MRSTRNTRARTLQRTVEKRTSLSAWGSEFLRVASAVMHDKLVRRGDKLLAGSAMRVLDSGPATPFLIKGILRVVRPQVLGLPDVFKERTLADIAVFVEPVPLGSFLVFGFPGPDPGERNRSKTG